MYGNNYSDNPESTRLYPFIMSKLCENFSYEDSKFSVHKTKDKTARVAMWRELKIPAVYTMEASFCGADFGPNKDYHFGTEHFLEAGKSLCLGLLIYCDVNVPKVLDMLDKGKQKAKDKSETVTTTKAMTRKILVSELIGDKKLLQSGKEDVEVGGSDSAPSEDNMEDEEMAKILPSPANKNKKKEQDKNQKKKPVTSKFFKNDSVEGELALKT